MRVLYNTNVLSDDVLGIADAVCFTSNGHLKKDGSLTMGAGNALQFRKKFPNIDRYAGELVAQNGNVCQVIRKFNSPSGASVDIVSFPTKDKFWLKSNLNLIEQSARKLMQLADENDWASIYLPAPGIGMGGLNWGDVKAAIEPFLDNRVCVIVYRK